MEKKPAVVQEIGRIIGYKSLIGATSRLMATSKDVHAYIFAVQPNSCRGEWWPTWDETVGKPVITSPFCLLRGDPS
jgi:hypothetical protein